MKENIILILVCIAFGVAVLYGVTGAFTHFSKSKPQTT